MTRTRAFLLGIAFAAMGMGPATAAPALAADTFRMAADGKTMIHAASGVEFPESLAGFKRVGQRAFDGEGQYVGVAYRRSLGGSDNVRLRIALVHIEEMTPKEHFVIMKPKVLRGLSDIATVSEGDYMRPGKGKDGYLGLYTAKDNGKPVGVALWTFDRGYWDLRGRVEYPIAKEKAARAAIDAFVDAFTALHPPYKSPE